MDPPSDYHKCMEEYAEGDDWRQPGGGGLLHSLCAWWAQGDDVLCTRTPLPAILTAVTRPLRLRTRKPS